MSRSGSTLIENRVFEPNAATVAAARIGGMAAYQALCAEAEATRSYIGCEYYAVSTSNAQLALDDRGLEAELRGADRRDIAAGAAAQDDHIKLVCHARELRCGD